MKKLIFILFFALSLAGYSTDYYWTGNDGNWNVTTNWTPNGTPTSSDNVFFNAGSFNGADQECNVNVEAYCNNFTYSGIDESGCGLVGGSSGLEIYGNVVLEAGANIDVASIEMYATAPKTITFHTATKFGKAIKCYGVGGTWTLQDLYDNSLTAVTLYNGTFDTNGFNHVFGGFSTSGTGTKALVVTTNTVTFSGWSNSGSTNFAFTPNTSTIQLTNFAGILVSGSTEFHNLSVIGIDNTSSRWTISGGPQTITNNLVIQGHNATTSRIFVNSNVYGTQRTLNAANVTVSNADFQSIIGAGAGSWE